MVNFIWGWGLPMEVQAGPPFSRGQGHLQTSARWADSVKCSHALWEVGAESSAR